MFFPISGLHIDPYYLVGVGFIIGILGGFFGVGGSFLANPALFAVGVPMNFVVGTDISHILGKSIVAVRKHRALGNVDLKLGLIMAFGTITGGEFGAMLIKSLTKRGNVNQVVGVVSIIVYVLIASFMAWEGWKTIQMRAKNKRAAPRAPVKEDESAIAHVAQRVQRIRLWPMVSLPTSGIAGISLWTIVFCSAISGFFSGFLGGGAGYIRMPTLVYLLGVPTHLAVGTDLFEIVISASYLTLSHAWKGNVDILIALVMHTGAAIGAQIGAQCTQFFSGSKIRLAFAPLPLIGAAIVAWKLWHGQAGGH